MSKRPVVGLTLDAEEPGGYSKLPWYALRKNYFTALADPRAPRPWFRPMIWSD